MQQEDSQRSHSILSYQHWRIPLLPLERRKVQQQLSSYYTQSCYTFQWKLERATQLSNKKQGKRNDRFLLVRDFWKRQVEKNMSSCNTIWSPVKKLFCNHLRWVTHKLQKPLKIQCHKYLPRTVRSHNYQANIISSDSPFNPSPHGPFYLLHLTAKGYIWPQF